MTSSREPVDTIIREKYGSSVNIKQQILLLLQIVLLIFIRIVNIELMQNINETFIAKNIVLLHPG